LGISEDITERKKLEAQLRQTQKMEAIGQLAGGVAHDFNNMLGVIIGYSEMALQKVAGDDALREDLKQIKMAGQRSAEITRQLLAFAREQAIIPRVIDLNKIVESMLKLLQRLIGENIDLAWHPGEHLWAVKMDPSQIDQILANLCVNAKDAIAGVGMITIETQNAALDATCVVDHKEFIPGEYIKLAVSDNGSGMDKQTQDRIFEPFFTTKGLGKGTRLGLATVYGIVKQNAGFIYVYSEPEHGTTFNIYLPRHAVAEADQENRQPHFSAVGHGSETILLVEDDGLFLFMVRQMLEQFGYKVLSTSTPGEAIIMAAENPGRIDLLLTDVIMPEMTGRELENKLSVLCPEIECLFMSGYTGNIIAHRGVIQADVNFIQKPFSAQALGTKVREILDSR
jgi:nitrogen-specific signal transduction histidine kinase